MADAPKPIVIIGAGGFASEGVWTAEAINAAAIAQRNGPVWDIRGFTVFDPTQFPSEIYSYPVLGAPAEVAARFAGTQIYFTCMIGENRIRERQAREAEALGWLPAALIHPTVVRARETIVGAGSYVGAGSILSPFSKLGEHVVINHLVSVGHDSVLGDFSQACPGARINGKCVVGRSALIGSNATLLPGCRLGDGAMVGAGSVALRGVASATTVMGVPAQLVG